MTARDMADRDLRLLRATPPQEPDGLWLRIEGLKEDLEAHVLVGFNDEGEPVVNCVRIAGPAVHTEHLRAIPLGQIERYLRFSIHRDASPSWEGHPDGRQYLVDFSDTGHPADVGRRRADETELDFADRVAKAYKWYAARSGKPAMEMAESNGVPVGTVRRWIREARALGVLEKGTRGKAG